MQARSRAIHDHRRAVRAGLCEGGLVAADEQAGLDARRDAILHHVDDDCERIVADFVARVLVPISTAFGAFFCTEAIPVLRPDPDLYIWLCPITWPLLARRVK